MSSGKLEKQYVSDLQSLFQAQGPQLYDGSHSLCLTNVCLYHLLKVLAALQDETSFNQFTDLRHLCDCLSKVQSLKLITDRKATVVPSLLNLDITLFKSLQTLTIRRIPIKSLSGLQRVREQLRSLIIERCGVSDIEDVIVRCGHDEALPFVWNCLKELDLSANSIIAIGESLQYLPSLERVNFSNNQIGSTDGSIDDISDKSDTNYCLSLTDGIKFIDSVKWLHLGYNRLICIPQFGDKAMYNLTVLILRNNSLRNIEGVEALDALIELDIGENLISQYSSLGPLQNLHNLTQLSLVGNPVTFDPRYRLKTVQHLSYCISATMFQLDGKKLSSTEKKTIPRHSSSFKRGGTPNSLSSSSLSLSNDPTDILSSPNSPQRNEQGSNIETTGKKSHQNRKSSVAKTPRLITFDEEDQMTSTPLKYGDKIMKDQALRSQLSESWLKNANVAAANQLIERQTNDPDQSQTSNPPDTLNPDITTLHSSELKTHSHTTKGYSEQQTDSDTTTGYSIIKTHSESSKMDNINSSTANDTRYSGQPNDQQSDNNHTTVNTIDTINNTEINSDDVIAVSQPKKKKNGKKRNKKKVTSELQKVVEVSDNIPVKVEENGKMADQGDTIITNSDRLFDIEESDDEKVSAIVTAEMFQVALYDSASEDDGITMDAEVLMTLSDRFIQEVTLNGVVQDQLDLQCLTAAKIKTRKFNDTNRHILVLHFNYERRDRRKREYLLADGRDECKIMKMLEPIIEQNTADVFTATKLECLKCQIVIDWSEALEDLSVPSPLSHHSLDHKSYSTQNKMCPHCKEKFLIIQEQLSGSQKRSFPRNDSPKVVPRKEIDTRQSFGFNMETDFHSTVDPETHSENPLSPGHMNVSMFDTYPEFNKVNNEESSIQDIRPFNITKDNNIVPPPPERLVTDKSETIINEDNSIDVSQHHLGNIFHHGNQDNMLKIQETNAPSLQPLNNSSDEGCSTHKQTSDYFDKHLDSNPFPDDNPLYSGSDHETHNTSPHTNHLLFADSPSSKSLSWSHFKPGVNSIDQDMFVKQKDQTSHRTSLQSSKPSTPVSIDSPTLGLTSSPVSASVPSENAGFMSYFRRNTKDKKATHSRTKSQDLQQYKVHVPPLPDNIMNISADRGATCKSSQESLKSKGNSQTSIASGGRDRNSSGEEKKGNSSNGGGGSGRFRFSVKKRKFSKSTDKICKSSSEAEEGKYTNSDLVLYRNNDPTYLHNNLVLHLSMNVFDNDKEKFQLALRAPMIQYGDWKQIETFLIVSNQMAYLYRVVGPENIDPDIWLELGDVLKLNEVVYIEIGVCYQSLRLEFDNPPRCYTFMIGIEECCRKIFDHLSYTVSDVPGSLFTSVRVTQFSLTHLVNPHKVLEKQIMEYYGNLTSSIKSSIKSNPSSIQEDDEDDEELEVFVLAHKYNHDSDLAKVLVALVLTNKHLYIGLGNPQWPFPALHLLPDKEDLLPPYSGVIRKDINDVEKLIRYDDNPLQLSIQFFKEGLYTDSRQSSWTVILRCSKSMKKFINCLNSSWYEQFKVDLPVVSV